MARKARIIDVVYNASNNELIRTKTLVKNAIIVIDASPFRQWYESHYLLPLGKKRELKAGEEDVLSKKRSKSNLRKYVKRQKNAKIDPAVEEQFNAGRLLGMYIVIFDGPVGLCAILVVRFVLECAFVFSMMLN